MYDLLIILLVGASCNYLDFYSQEMPGLFVACAGEETLYGAEATYSVLSAHGWNVVYVIDEKRWLPEIDHPEVEGAKLPLRGVAYLSQNYAIAWRYVEVVIHEAAHLTCGCHHGPLHDFEMTRLQSLA